MDVKQVFAKRLKDLREKEGLNQTELAEKLGVSRGSISYYETGERTPDIVTLYKACQYFGVTSDYFLDITQNATAENESIRQLVGLSDGSIEALNKLVRLAKISPFILNHLHLINGLLCSKQFMEEVIPAIVNYELGEYYFNKLEEEYAEYKEFLERLDERSYDFEYVDGVFRMKNPDDEAKRMKGINLRDLLNMKREAQQGHLYRIQRLFMDNVEIKHDEKINPSTVNL